MKKTESEARPNQDLITKYNILDFIGSDDKYWGEIDQRTMGDFIETSLKDGYLEAMIQLARTHTELRDYFFNPRRIDWLFHCLTQNNSRPTRVLDIGSGWGTISFLLTKYFDEVWSVEPGFERALFQGIRQAQAKENKLHIVRCWAHLLPFPNEFFDLVVANGILEWVPLGDLTKDPQKIQLDFMREAYRVSKVGGCLYLGVENRIAYSYFLGGKDHSGLPYTSLLPRPLASLIVALLGGYKNRTGISKRYATYTYSALGCKKLLTLAGFHKVDTYCTNDYNLPTISYRIADVRAFDYFLMKAATAKTNFVSRLPNSVKNLLMFLSPSFLFFAYKKVKPETFEDELMDSVSSVNTSSFVTISGNRAVTYHLLAPNGRPLQLAKVPRFKDDQSEHDEKEKLLTHINELPLQDKNLFDTHVVIEKYLDGISFAILNNEHNSQALEWLFDFQKKTCKGHSTKGEICSEIKDLLTYAKALNTKCEKSIEKSLKNMNAIDHICVAEHGDFWAENILFYNDRLYVLDWEDYNERGNQLFDPLFFLIANSLYTERPNGLASFYKNWTGTGSYSPILKRNLQRFKDALNLDPSILIDAFPYVMLEKIISCDPRINRWRNDYFFFQMLLNMWYAHKDKISRYLYQRK